MLIVIGTVVGLYLGATLVIYGSLIVHKTNEYNNSFHTKYALNDFNDSRIIFYKKELEKYSQRFNEGSGKYELFAADVQRDLALNCIQAALQEYNVSNWVIQGSQFRDNARNKYATTKASIKKAKKNEAWMSNNFYTYDLNAVRHIEDEIASIWDSKKNSNTCNILMPAEKMYERFMVKYLFNRQKSVFLDKDYAWRSKSDKSFFEEKIATTQAWIKELLVHFPHMKNNPKPNYVTIEEKNNKMMKIIEENRKKHIANLNPITAAIEMGDDDALSALLALNNNVNQKDANGNAPIFSAIKYHNNSSLKILLKHGVNTNIFDRQNNTPLTYSIERNWIDTVQILLESGVDPNFRKNNNQTALTIALRECKNFKMVQLLLKYRADPYLIDEFHRNSIQTIPLYCKDRDNRNKMLKLLKRSHDR